MKQIFVKSFCLGLFLMAASTPPASAAPWIVEYSKSKLGFVGMQDTAAFNGMFRNFQASIDFDPAHPETGKISATIDMASATAGSDDRDGYLPQADWFDTKKFPQAQFTSTSIKAATGANCFEATGTLTIKGMTKPLTLPFCLKTDGALTHAVGEVQIMRTDFGIGLGQWASETYVKHAVDVTVDIAAHQ